MAWGGQRSGEVGCAYLSKNGHGVSPGTIPWVLPEVGGESLEENRQRMRATVEHLARLLKLGMESGTFEARDPFLVAGTVLGMVNMPYILYQSGKMVDPELRDRMIEEVLSAAMAYLKKR